MDRQVLRLVASEVRRAIVIFVVVAGRRVRVAVDDDAVRTRVGVGVFAPGERNRGYEPPGRPSTSRNRRRMAVCS